MLRIKKIIREYDHFSSLFLYRYSQYFILTLSIVFSWLIKVCSNFVCFYEGTIFELQLLRKESSNLLNFPKPYSIQSQLFPLNITCLIKFNCQFSRVYEGYLLSEKLSMPMRQFHIHSFSRSYETNFTEPQISLLTICMITSSETKVSFYLN